MVLRVGCGGVGWVGVCFVGCFFFREWVFGSAKGKVEGSSEVPIFFSLLLR